MLGGCPGHRAIVAALPGLGERAAGLALAGLGLAETALAAWILSGWRPRAAAAAQTVLLVAMNGGGLLWGRAHIADPGAMLTQNLAFLTLAWIVAGRAARPEPEDGSPWRRGRFDGRAGPPQLLFGRMHEDWRVEAAAFPPGGRVLCIASAGCTAMALAARGHRVTAVDVNPAQIEYVRARLDGGRPRDGAAERLVALFRRALPWFGLRRRDLEAFLELDDPAAQLRFWRERLATRRLRLALRCALHPALLRLRYGRDFLRGLPPRFDLALLARLERTWARHPNRDNPYAWHLFLDCEPPAPEAPPVPRGRIELLCADAVAVLETCAPGSFDGLSLSNVLDAAPDAYRERALAAARRAAAPGGVLVLRTFGPPASPEAAAWAERDRSALWGGIEVTTLAPASPPGAT